MRQLVGYVDKELHAFKGKNVEGERTRSFGLQTFFVFQNRLLKPFCNSNSLRLANGVLKLVSQKTFQGTKYS